MTSPGNLDFPSRVISLEVVDRKLGIEPSFFCLLYTPLGVSSRHIHYVL